MLHHLSPSEDVIGGLWFSDGELDVDLVETLAQVICRFVEKGSWKEVPLSGPGAPNGDTKRRTDGQREQTKKRSREAEAKAEGEPQPQSKKRRMEDPRQQVIYDDDGNSNNLERDSENDLFMTDTSQHDDKSNNNKDIKITSKPQRQNQHPYQHQHQHLLLEPNTRFRPKIFPSSSSNSNSNPKSRKSRLIPLPSTSPSFPTASSILHFLQQTQISQVELTPSDLRTLLDMLVYDGRLERIGGPAEGSGGSFVEGHAGSLARKGEEILAELDSEGIPGAGAGAGVYKYRTVRALERDGDIGIACTTVASNGGGVSSRGAGAGAGIYAAIEDGLAPASAPGAAVTGGVTAAAAAAAAGRVIGSGPGNGLSEVPCGRCPVFNLCEVGGPVNAEECVYLDEWLRVKEAEFERERREERRIGLAGSKT